MVSFTGVLPKNQIGAYYGSLIIRDAEIPDFSDQDDPLIVGYNNPVINEARKGIACLPTRIGRLIAHNLKGLDRICKGLTKKEVFNLYGGGGWNNQTLEFFDGAHYIGGKLLIEGMCIGSKEIYDQLNRLCAFFVYGEDTRFICFTDRNNNIIGGPYKRMPDKIEKIAWNHLEYIEDRELIPVPLGNYKQDEDGFFEEK